MKYLGKYAPINGHGEGLAHTHVVEGFTVRDKAVVISPELGDPLETGHSGQARLFENGYAVVVDEIDLPLFVQGQRCGLLIDHEHLDFFDSGLAKKKLRIGPELDLVFMFP